MIPQELEVIPGEYFSPAVQQGTLVVLYYDTFESRTHNQKTQKLRKRAIVYLPYGYSEEHKYNVLYLMHGGWSNETTTLGTPERPSPFKNVIDNAIAEGAFKPLIIVCPTYNNLSREDSGNYSLAFYTLTVNYHNELVNDLIPAIESEYSVKASRDHRAFGGFSMGSVATWYTFINCLNQFRFFLPMSGSTGDHGESIDAAVSASGRASEDFLIYAITGSKDFACGNFTRQVKGMLGMPSGNFVAASQNSDGNLAFRTKKGYTHDGVAAMEYTYNGLRQFWNT